LTLRKKKETSFIEGGLPSKNPCPLLERAFQSKEKQLSYNRSKKNRLEESNSDRQKIGQARTSWAALPPPFIKEPGRSCRPGWGGPKSTVSARGPLRKGHWKRERKQRRSTSPAGPRFSLSIKKPGIPIVKKEYRNGD